MMLHEEIRRIKSSKKGLKIFGLTVGIVSLLIGLSIFYGHKGAAIYWAGMGLLLIGISISVPGVLKPLNKIWMIMSIVLGWVMTRVLLTISFYIVLTPTGLILRLLRKDLLDPENR